MLIPFTLKDFLEMVEIYNTTFWPMPILAYAIAFLALFFCFKKKSYSGKIVSGVLAFFWLWTGIVFNFLYFSKLFPSATVFAILFTIQGILFLLTGVFRQNLSFRVKPDIYGIIGGIFIAYALFGYPSLEYLLGRGYPQLLSFGIVPCPTATFTLGLLLWSDKKLPGFIIIIPVLYAISGIVPIYLGIIEDTGLVIAGVLTAIFIFYRNHKRIVV
ncbi:MAG: hypothetical protein IH594_00195 [Bacteroidales bacterium]|nr:hypothetical protein [Bacteroidales bacterium]